jgi:dTDP-glucose pyrophosphorylase
MKKLSQSGAKCLMIVDVTNKLLGTLTDGDLRKAILNGANINVTVDGIFQSKPTVLIKNKFTQEGVKKLFRENKFDLIPVVNDEGKLSDIIFWESVFNNGKERKKKKLVVPVIIMAGGKGTRLQPFTKVLPKPLVPVHEKPIIEHIIEQFTDVGCNNFYMTINYKGKILKAYFEEIELNYLVNFVEEKEPLGTAGSLHLLDGKFKEPVFVTNCDIIIKTDYFSLYEFHKKGDYDLTLVASAKEYIIPYGTCELNDNGDLSHINEKPKYEFLINTGLYVLNPDLFQLIPRNKFYNITQLIEDAKNKGKKVGVYPIDDDAWVDVGEWSEYQKALIKL